MRSVHPSLRVGAHPPHSAQPRGPIRLLPLRSPLGPETRSGGAGPRAARNPTSCGVHQAPDAPLRGEAQRAWPHSGTHDLHLLRRQLMTPLLVRGLVHSDTTLVSSKTLICTFVTSRNTMSDMGSLSWRGEL